MSGLEALLAIPIINQVVRKITDYDELLVSGCMPLCSFRKDLEGLTEELLHLGALLKKEEEKLLFGNKDDRQSVHFWHRAAKSLAFDIEDTIDQFDCSEERYQGSSCAQKAPLLCSKLNPMVVRVSVARSMKSDTRKLNRRIQLRERYKLDSRINSTGEFGEKQTTSFDGPPIIGREEDARNINDIISRQGKQLSIITIVGHVGLGKTSLARRIFNDTSTVSKFSRRIWIHVSKGSLVLDIQRIGRDIISQGAERIAAGDTQMQEITTRVHAIMSSHSCLTVLDGLWGHESEVKSLKQMLISCGKTESTIIVTTHDENVAQLISTAPVCRLAPLLVGDYCSEIFEKAVGCRTALFDRYGKEIISRCQGIPLVANFLGSVVSTGPKSHEIWESARDKEMWKLEEDYIKLKSELTLFASFKPIFYNMHHKLRLCFAYCSIFPKGSILDKKKLIQQWIALNMVEPPTHSAFPRETIAEDIIEQLKAIHFLQDAAGSHGAPDEMLCMHYLAYELARFISNKDILVILEDEQKTSSTYCDYRYARLPASTLLSMDCKDWPQKARSLILKANEQELNLVSQIISEHKYLRVLDLSGCSIMELPACVCELNQLRYLDASNMAIKELPSVDNRLKKLIYLKLQRCSRLQRLHESFGKLVSLEYLDLSHCVGLTELPTSFEKLRKSSCYIDLSGCQDCIVQLIPRSNTNAELAGESAQQNEVPNPQPNQRSEASSMEAHKGFSSVEGTGGASVPGISESEILECRPELPLESTSLSNADEREEYQPSTPGETKCSRHGKQSVPCSTSSLTTISWSSNSTIEALSNGRIEGTSLQSDPAEHGTEEHQPCQSSVKSQDGYTGSSTSRKLKGTHEESMTTGNMTVEETIAVDAHCQHEKLALPKGSTPSYTNDGKQHEDILEENTNEGEIFIPDGKQQSGLLFYSSSASSYPQYTQPKPTEETKRNMPDKRTELSEGIKSA